MANHTPYVDLDARHDEDSSRRRMIERRTPRLYIASGLACGVEAELDRAQAHYLRSVLRLDTGAAIAAFNPTDGEWLCRVAEFGKRGARLSVEAQLRGTEPETETDL